MFDQTIVSKHFDIGRNSPGFLSGRIRVSHEEHDTRLILRAAAESSTDNSPQKRFQTGQIEMLHGARVQSRDFKNSSEERATRTSRFYREKAKREKQAPTATLQQRGTVYQKRRLDDDDVLVFF